jgi:hypothetical protein
MKIIMPHSLSVGIAAGAETGGLLVKVEVVPAALLPWVVVKAPTPRVLKKLPAVATVTFTVTVQVPDRPPEAIGMVAPLRSIVPVPDTAVSVGLPQPLVVAPLGVAIIIPAGKVSVNVAFVSGTVVLEFDRIMVRVDVAPVMIAAGLKLLPIVGA